MVIFIVEPDAHCPILGVKVYTDVPTVDVFITAGDQIPVMVGVFAELAGNIPGVVFWQYGPNGVNTGNTGFVMVMVIVAFDAH
jgi:hypothetical protein